MSGECEKCSECAVDCKCQKHAKYFFRNKYYEGEKEFFQATHDYLKNPITEEDFNYDFEFLIRDLWVNLGIRERYNNFKFSGADMKIFCDIIYLEFFKYIQTKYDKQENADG